MDLKQVEELLKLMATYGADSIKLEDKDTRIKIQMTPRQTRRTDITDQTQAHANNGMLEVSAAKTPDDLLRAVLCPTVGVFYAAAGPDEPPFVRVGDQVAEDTILCIVEAMKVMNEIPAGIAGTVVQILPVNGDRVEYEQTLFLIRADS